MNRAQPPNDAAAIRAFPALAALIAIRDAGWTFAHRDVIEGVPVQIDAYRVWPGGWIDAVRVRGEDDAMALRTDGDDPPGIVWERTGSLIRLVEELLSLPAPGDRLAPRLVVATGPRLWTPV